MINERWGSHLRIFQSGYRYVSTSIAYDHLPPIFFYFPCALWCWLGCGDVWYAAIGILTKVYLWYLVNVWYSVRSRNPYTTFPEICFQLKTPLMCFYKYFNVKHVKKQGLYYISQTKLTGIKRCLPVFTNRISFTKKTRKR